jgi:hypothetical protein
MSACQVIKADGKYCRNYARKGLTCCYPHRALENTEPEVPVDESFSPVEEPVKPFNFDYVKEQLHLLSIPKSRKKPVFTEAGMKSKIECGKRLAMLNSIRREFLTNAKINGEW